MPSLLRPVAAWIAIACMAIGSLLPLASQAAAKSSPEMAICSTSASWQSPTGAPGRTVEITYDQFQRWAREVDRNRQNVEGIMDRLRRIFR